MTALRELAERKYSDAQLTAVARALCRDNSQVCNVNNDDNWKMYSEDYIAQARVALAALASVKTLDAEGDGGAVGDPVLTIGECAELIWHQGGPCQLAPDTNLYTHHQPVRSGGVSDDARDAERYRWLRVSACEIAWNEWCSYSPGYSAGGPEELDQAIDAAIKSQGESNV